VRILYADESGRWSRVGTDYVGMGAVDATGPTWHVFNSRWTAALKKHDAPYLHMKEFIGSNTAFKGWTEDQRRGLLGDLLGCLNGLQIYMFAAVLKCKDFEELPSEEREGLVDPYFCVFQDCLFGIGLAGYIGMPGEKVDVVYSQQDEFSKRFKELFDTWKRTTTDGANLGVLSFQSMVGVPGLQLADLVAYEMMHYYYLREFKPHLKARYPFQKLCEHQIGLNAGMFKYTPAWKLKMRSRGSWQAVQEVMWDDIDTFMPMLRQLAPPEMVSDARLERIAMLRKQNAVARLRRRELREQRSSLERCSRIRRVRMGPLLDTTSATCAMSQLARTRQPSPRPMLQGVPVPTSNALIKNPFG
jgi:hypothetical protein